MGYQCAQMLLFHGLDATGSIEVSTSSSGPWTKLTLTSTKSVNDALVEWTTLANAAIGSRTWSFHFHTGDPHWIHLEVTAGGSAFVRLPSALAYLFGITTGNSKSVAASLVFDVTAGGVTSDVACAGLLGSSTGQFAVGLSFPLEVESAEITEYRGGRGSVLHYARASEVTVDLLVHPDLWDVVRESPMLSGHAALLVQHDVSTAFGEATLDGALVLYPLEPLGIEQDSPDDHVWIRLRCTRSDVEEVAADEPLSISDGDTYDFGALTAAGDHTFTVTNNGALSATGIAGRGLANAAFTFVGGSFPGTGGTLGATLASGASGTVVVRFTPTAGADAAGQLTIAYTYSGGARSTTRPIIGRGA